MMSATSGPVSSRWSGRSVVLALVGFPVLFVAGGAWSLIVGTASPGGDPEVRGWKAVLYNLPLSAVSVAVMSLAMCWAALALRRHEDRLKSLRAMWISTIAFALSLGVITASGAEAVMTTRSATMKWVLFGGDVVVAAVFALLLLRWARRGHAAPVVERTRPTESHPVG